MNPYIEKSLYMCPFKAETISPSNATISLELKEISMGFCYGWDTREPTWQTKFADGNQWEKGHWISGKIKRKYK